MFKYIAYPPLSPGKPSEAENKFFYKLAQTVEFVDVNPGWGIARIIQRDSLLLKLLVWLEKL